MKLLNIDSNAKTVKGQKQGYMTAILYLAPASSSGVNLCPMAKQAGCENPCLNVSGHAGISKGSATFSANGTELPDNAIQRARLARSELFNLDRDAFMAQLVGEIRAFIKKAERKNLVPVVRLNGTSDILWENISVGDYPNIMSAFPEIQFYDYTKVYKRLVRPLPANYHLSLSYSEASQKYAIACQTMAQYREDANLVVVFRKELPDTFMGRKVINGDESDLRFLDSKGVIVGLKAKGRAKKDDSGFVIDHTPFTIIAAA
jgi:fructose-specific component phosphotransferase system IIB-like protein